MTAPALTAVPEPAITLPPNGAGHHPALRDDDDELHPAWLDPEGAAPPLPDQEAQLLALGNRLLQLLGDVEQERAANAAAEKIQLEYVKARYRRLDEPLARRVAGLSRALEAIHYQLPQRGKAKSHKLAYGTIGTRSRGQRVEVLDAEAVKAALRENADAGVVGLIIRPVTTEKIDHKALTTFVAANRWAELPGTVVHPAADTFYADPDVGGTGAQG